MRRNHFILIALALLLSSASAFSQQYASTRIKDKYEAYTDSLKQVEYNYLFPIWGQKAYEKGFEDMRKRLPDISKAKAMIGFQPKIKLESTLEDIIEFYKK